jgi:hypothetical protein
MVFRFLISLIKSFPSPGMALVSILLGYFIGGLMHEYEESKHPPEPTILEWWYMCG